MIKEMRTIALAGSLLACAVMEAATVHVRAYAGEQVSPGVTVTLIGDDGTMRVIMTDVNGAGVFSDVPPGTYTLQSAIYGPEDAQRSRVRVSEPEVEVPVEVTSPLGECGLTVFGVAPGAPPPDLRPPTTITTHGLVRDDAGRPLRGVTVRAGKRMVRTNRDGTFRLVQKIGDMEKRFLLSTPGFADATAPLPCENDLLRVRMYRQ